MWFTARWTSAQEISSLWKHLFRAGHSGRNIFAGKTLGTWWLRFVPREIRKDIVFSLLNEWSIQEVYSGIPIFHIGRIVWNHGYPRHALCLVHVCSVLVVFNLWLCSCHECFRSSGGKQNPTTWPRLCGEKRIVRSITACDWGVQISTACFEVSWHPCFFFGLGLIQFPGFGWRDVVECERLASHNILCGSWMIMVDQHPTNGLLGGTTKSLLDSSLDKFHEAVKFQEKKADLSFGPPNKIIPVDCSESIQIILNLITSKICGFGSKLDTENGMGCSTSQQISPKFDQIVVGD